MASQDSSRQPSPDRRLGHRRTHGRRVQKRPRVVGRRDPRMPYPIAAAAVGILVAVLARVLVFAGEQACAAVRGTTSCGNAGGLMLLAIGALMVFVGTRMLRLLAVPEPGVASMLGVALLGIVVLGVLVDDIFSPWMWVVFPLVSAVVYAFSAWAATTLSEMGKS